MMILNSGGDDNVCADETQTHVQTIIHIHIQIHIQIHIHTNNELPMNEFTNVHVCAHFLHVLTVQISMRHFT
jgi:hypothetical protein